jgi:hypothetical protein
MRGGADAIIHKPVAPEALTGAVVRLLASRRAWRGKVVPHPRSLPHRAKAAFSSRGAEHAVQGASPTCANTMPSPIDLEPCSVKT